MSRTYSKYLLPIFRMDLRVKIQITNFVADFLSFQHSSRVEWLLTIPVSHQIILTLTILNNCHVTNVFLAG